MKKSYLSWASFVLVTGLTACNSNDSNSATNDEGKAPTTNTATGSNHIRVTSTGATSTNTKLPMSPADSTFVVKAATGGMMEVEAGKIAQQNAQNPRVKAFAAMMVRDHSEGNQDLSAAAGMRGLQIPPSLPPDVQKHITAMRNMKGKAFDSHYMSMMVNDHKKTVEEFEKQANNNNNAELKTLAAKMLPILIMHRDSAIAISQSIK